MYLEKQPGDEPVTIDKVTGLHWTSCAAGMRGAGCDQGTPAELSIEEALAYCDELSWAGHSDWYLPDIYELTSLADLSEYVGADPANRDFLSDAAFPNQEPVRAFYWSTSYVDNAQLTFSTGKNEGSYPSIAASFPFDPYSVLCVRRGFSRAMPDGPRFVAHDGELGEHSWVEDRATGLGFQRCSTDDEGGCNGAYTAEQAAPHCAELTVGGFDDWRVPSYKEVQALFDPYEVRAFDPPFAEDFFGPIRGILLFAGPGSLLDLEDMSRVGIGLADKTYPVLCTRGPL